MTTCNSCGGETLYDPKVYQGGYYCPNKACPAGQELADPYRAKAEEAAEIAHNLWAHWMKHYFTLENPEVHYERWIRLMHTPYKDLTEQEKESDRKVSGEILAALRQSAREGGEKERDEAYEAFHFLSENHEWAIKSLDVWMSKVHPQTREISDKEEENTRHEYWLEGGPFERECMTFSHDYELDCGGGTFEEAIIKYAELVRKKYGGRTDIDGNPATTREGG